MSGYICVNGTILDQDKMAEYAGKAGKVIATVDGHSYGKAKILEVLAKLQK